MARVNFDHWTSWTGSPRKRTNGDDEESLIEVAGPRDLSHLSNPLIFLNLCGEDQGVYKVSDNACILTVHPFDELDTEFHFRFSKIFHGHDPNKNLFRDCVQPLVTLQKSFSVLIFDFPNADIALTMLGDENQPGMLPRALHHLFCSYEGEIAACPTRKPFAANNFFPKFISKNDGAQLVKQTQHIVGQLPLYPNIHFLLKKIRQEQHFKPLSCAISEVTIWLSFIEFQNEFAYDLLMKRDLNKPRPRVPLKMFEGDYFKKVTMLYVKDSMEALRILEYGLATKKMYNETKSSHLLLAVKVIEKRGIGKYEQKSYNFCVLEPPKQNFGDVRSLELPSSDNTLKAVQQCLVAIKAGQTRKVLVPIHQSILTKFLKPAILGKEMLIIVSRVDTFHDVADNINTLCDVCIGKEPATLVSAC